MKLQEIINSANASLDLPGIYLIYCLLNDSGYIGQTSFPIRKRKAQHFSDLRKEKHPNQYLQSVFNKYGQDLTFIPLENCGNEQLNEREAYFYTLLDVEKKMNLGTVGQVIPMSEESKRKISRAQKGIKDGPLSEETKQKLSVALKGKIKPPFSKEHRRKLSEIGKQRSLTKAKLSTEQILEIKALLLEGHSQIGLSRKFSIGRTTIHEIANNKKWTHVGPTIPNTIPSKNLPHILNRTNRLN